MRKRKGLMSESAVCILPQLTKYRSGLCAVSHRFRRHESSVSCHPILADDLLSILLNKQCICGRGKQQEMKLTLSVAGKW